MSQFASVGFVSGSGIRIWRRVSGDRCQLWMKNRCHRTTSTSMMSHAMNSSGEVYPEEIVWVEKEPDKFAGVSKWVVFSDLHVRQVSIGPCIEALRFVHGVAVERNAGVAFLGDFWHARSALPVEPLNAIIKEMITWTQVSVFFARCRFLIHPYDSDPTMFQNSTAARDDDPGQSRSSLARWSHPRP